MFYFFLCYFGDIVDSIKEMLFNWLLMLIEWVNFDKVDCWELYRNVEIFKV